MSEENKKPVEQEEVEQEEDENQLENRTIGNLEAVGQIILGEVEKIGGILMADPIAQAEGEYNIEVGNLHQEVNKKLTATDPVEDEEEETEENI